MTSSLFVCACGAEERRPGGRISYWTRICVKPAWSEIIEISPNSSPVRTTRMGRWAISDGRMIKDGRSIIDVNPEGTLGMSGRDNSAYEHPPSTTSGLLLEGHSRSDRTYK